MAENSALGAKRRDSWSRLSIEVMDVVILCRFATVPGGRAGYFRWSFPILVVGWEYPVSQPFVTRLLASK